MRINKKALKIEFVILKNHSVTAIMNQIPIELYILSSFLTFDAFSILVQY